MLARRLKAPASRWLRAARGPPRFRSARVVAFVAVCAVHCCSTMASAPASTATAATTASTATATPVAATATASTTVAATAAEAAGTATVELSPGGGVDRKYPGTAVARREAILKRVRSLTSQQLSGDWEEVRLLLLWAGGLKDLRNVAPGRGYTGHAFNDFNHCDLCAMADNVSFNENDGSVDSRIARGNWLGPGIRIASDPELGPGGSWSTCMLGCERDPPQDVSHIQFRARIAFKLVWAPMLDTYDTFVLVGDEGELLATGSPTGTLPDIRQRALNFHVVRDSKYGVEALAISRRHAAEAAPDKRVGEDEDGDAAAVDDE